MKTLQQKKTEKMINLMFQGLEDDLLKQALLVAYAGEDEKTMDEMLVANEQDFIKTIEQMKIQDAQAAVLTDEEKQKIIYNNINIDGGENTNK